MVSTSNDSYFDGVMRDITRSSWSTYCSAATRAAMLGQSLHEAILSTEESDNATCTRAVQLILAMGLRHVDEPLQHGLVHGTHRGFTPLMTALVSCRGPEVVRLLIAHGASTDVACADDAHNTPLHYACFYRATESLPLLVMSTPNHVLVAPNDEGETPLHVAASRCFPDVIEAVLGHFASLHQQGLVIHRLMHGADADKRDDLSHEAFAARNSSGKTFAHLLVASERTDAIFVQCLEKVINSAMCHDTHNLCDNRARSLLFYANSSAAVELLVPALPDELPVDSDLATPLHVASACSSTSAVDALCTALATRYSLPRTKLIAMQTANGDTCLHRAGQHPAGGNMKLLLEMFDEPVDRGHVLLAKNGSKESVLHVAAASGAAASIACIRQHVVARGFASSAARQLFVQEILEQRNSMDFSPVLIASCSDEGPTLQALVDLVAAAEHPRKSAALQCHCVRQKTTAVSLSLSCGAAASAKVLLAALAEASADEQKAVLLAVNDDGNTCLMAAVESGNLEALHVLLAAPMLVSATQQIREALHHRNRSGRTLCEIVDGQCGMRRSAMSLPNSPLKSMTSTFSAVEWEGVDPSVVLFATREVCTCERRRACNAKAAHAMIISSVAPRPRSHGPAPSLDL